MIPGSPKPISVGTKRCVEWGCGYGESEYEVSFGLAPWNGVQIRTSSINWCWSVKIWVSGRTHSEKRGQWLNWMFSLTFEVAKLDFFFGLTFVISLHTYSFFAPESIHVSQPRSFWPVNFSNVIEMLMS